VTLTDYSIYKHLSDININNVVNDTIVEDFVTNSAGAYPNLYLHKIAKYNSAIESKADEVYDKISTVISNYENAEGDKTTESYLNALSYKEYLKTDPYESFFENNYIFYVAGDSDTKSVIYLNSEDYSKLSKVNQYQCKKIVLDEFLINIINDFVDNKMEYMLMVRQIKPYSCCEWPCFQKLSYFFSNYIAKDNIMYAIDILVKNTINEMVNFLSLIDKDTEDLEDLDLYSKQLTNIYNYFENNFKSPLNSLIIESRKVILDIYILISYIKKFLLQIKLHLKFIALSITFNE
jgi:hypothetical protein